MLKGKLKSLKDKIYGEAEAEEIIAKASKGRKTKTKTKKKNEKKTSKK